MVQESSTYPPAGGCYAFRVLICMRETPPDPSLPFCTIVETDTDYGHRYLQGHYDMTLKGALEDYGARCEREGVNPGKGF